MFLFSFQYKIYIIFMQKTTASSFLLLSLSFSLKSLPLYLFTSPLSLFLSSIPFYLPLLHSTLLSPALSLSCSLSPLSISLKTITQVLDDELIRAQNIWVNTDKESDQLFVTQQVTNFNIVKISPFSKKAVFKTILISFR